MKYPPEPDYVKQEFFYILSKAKYTIETGKIVFAIEGMFRKRTASKLLEGRGAMLPGIQEQVTEQTDFDLITWLVIR